ncbi:MAG: glycosyltransferase [Chloroflexia bacterium]
MRIAVFVAAFPLVSEVFILRQVTGLIDLGHKVDIYAKERADASVPMHPEVREYGLLARTTYVEMPTEARYELPAWPVTERTWVPGAEKPVWNAARLLRALPVFARCALASPHMTRQALDPSEYGYQARSLSSLYRLSMLLPRRRSRYDLLHAHFGPTANSFRFARALLKAPLVVSFHGYDFSAWPRAEGAGVYARLFGTADAVTVNSEHTRARLAELGCPPGKLHKLPVGVDLEAFPFRERAPEPGEPVRVLTVGRLVEKKGLEYSILAVAAIRQTQSALHYDIVGDGPLRPQLEKLVRELGLQDVVTLHGALDGDTVRRMMANAQIFVLASVTAADGDEEGQGLVLQEAQASGLPVLATEHDGFAESIIPGRSGFLVPERDVEGLAERLAWLLERPELWPQMGRAGREHVEERYDIHKLNRQLEALYARVISNFQERRRRA